MQTNYCRQIKKAIKNNEMKHWKYSYDCKHLEINRISALNNPWGVDIPFNT